VKNVRLWSLAAASLFSLLSAGAATFGDVQFWVGSGANQAGFIVDWNDGKAAESIMWGYRWDGAASGLDMFQAVVNADPRLFAYLGNYSWGTAIQGIGYDVNQSGGFGVSPALTFGPGGLALGTSPNDARAAADPNDHWVEGWNSGFWAYYTKGAAADPWTSATVGAGDRALVNNAWDGYSFAPGFAGPEPGEPVAAVVPEPSTLALIFAGGLFLACARRHRS
jgi:hypothetical protein